MNGITKQRAAEFGLAPQEGNESEGDFRHRVAGALRERGHLIEAHEAQQDRLYDDPAGGGDVMTGVTGAVAQALHGLNFRPRDGIHQVGDDIAVGALANKPKSMLDDPMMALLAVMLAGS